MYKAKIEPSFLSLRYIYILACVYVDGRKTTFGEKIMFSLVKSKYFNNVQQGWKNVPQQQDNKVEMEVRAAQSIS